MNNHRYILSVLFTAMIVISANGQSYVTPVRSDITPPAPQSSSLIEVQAPQPDLLTGAASISVPIYNIDIDGIKCPISLQYQSNGIKVFDDPAPVGYGWSLMPALRITRTIMGRPDEKYQFSGDPMNATDPVGMQYMSTVYAQANSKIYTDRYDSEHDIFNISLPGKTFTRIIDASAYTLEFIGACDDEYRVRADKKLDTIIVTDPSGIRYYYGEKYECYYDKGGVVGRTAWALYKIVSDNGRTVNFQWGTGHHPVATRQWIGGYSFRDKWDLYHWSNSGTEQDSFDNDNYAQAVLSKNNETDELLQLKSIQFPGGSVSFVYTSVENTGNMLTSIKISSTTSVIQTYNLSYADSYSTLLTKIDGGAGKTYTFEYNTEYGTNPFVSYASGLHSQDWWGYYNAKENPTLTPKLKIRKYYSQQSTSSSGYKEVGEADRSVDTKAMQALILTKVTWPAGGTSAFEYEAHQFAPTRVETEGEIEPSCDPYLSIGGGLRVKQITTSDGTAAHDMVVRYEYPLAQVRAVPSAATFVEINDVVFPMPDVPSYTEDPAAEMRMVNIMPVSDYMRYDNGATPLWYDKVTTVWPEGKTETYFDDILDIDLSRPKVSYGHRLPGHMSHLFDGTPAMTKQVIYKTEGNSYIPVETTEYSYQAVSGSKTPYNYHIVRNKLYLDGDEPNCPDFIDGREMNGGPKNFGAPYYVSDTYYSYPYDYSPYAKRLISKTHTVHTETGDVVNIEQYSYKTGTGLLNKIVGNSSDGRNMTVSIGYPETSNGGTEASMVSANATGVPLRESIVHGTATTDVKARYIRTSSGAFRQRLTSLSYGNQTPLVSPVCEYDCLGHIIRVTDADSIVTEWTWDSAGLYPIIRNQDGIQTLFSYKPLVGVTGITEPFGAVSTYEYDNMNRLIRYNIAGLGEMQTFSYNFVPDANRISTSTRFDDTRHIVRTEHYDNLGRKIRTEDSSTDITQHFRYDAMGRMYAASMPSSEAPSSDYDYEKKFYEPSPRGVVVSSVKSGKIWQDNGKYVTVRTVANMASGELSAPMYIVLSNGQAEHRGNYAAGQLLVEEITDENGHVTREYSDKSGNTVMTEEGDGGVDMRRTRFVYDDYGRLRFILPPSFADGNINTSDGTFIKNCHEFGYDAHGRMSLKRTPGATEKHRMVYSDGGRLVAEHTPTMGTNSWMAYFYDKHGRLAYTSQAGLMDTEVEWHRQDFPIAEFIGNGLYCGYRLVPEPRAAVDQAISAEYYDDYSFLSQSEASYLPQLSGSRPGLPTGSYDRATGYSAIEYDDWGRVVAKYRKTAKGLLTTRNFLNKGGTAYKTTVSLSCAGTTYNMTTLYGYDNGGRISSWTTSLGTAAASAKITYGKTGAVADETFGNNVRRTYSYDCHGWINNIRTSIPKIPVVIKRQSPLSAIEGFYPRAYGLMPDTNIVLLNEYKDYDEKILYSDGSHPRYDGSASAHISSLGVRYDYVFDNHDRLVKAISSGGTKNKLTANFSAEYSYNEVGAPLTVKRHGVKSVGQSGDLQIESYGILDNLSYNYDGMLLSDVTAVASGTDFYGRTGFPLSAAGGTATYTWTPAGTLKTDSSRGIKRASYNWRGQPVSIDFTDGGYLSYRYDKDGVLVAVDTYALLTGKRPKLVNERRYCDNFVFEGDSLLYVNFPGGYFDGNGRVHYRHADFQGNTTMVTDASGTLEQHTGYYPYGEPWREPTGQPYLYGGKERMRDGALNDYDFTARRLNSALCLWSTPDPCALDYGSLNPYIYCAANPIRFTDPDGRLILDNDGIYFYNTNKTIDLTFSVSEQNPPQTLEFTLGFVFSSQGEPIAVLQYCGDVNIKDNSSNCHGYTFLEGQYWINDDDGLNTILSEYTQVLDINQSQRGDVVLFESERKDGYVADLGTGEYVKQHSATILSKNEDGTITMDAKVLNITPHNESYYKQKRDAAKTTIFRKTVMDRQLKKDEEKQLTKNLPDYEKKLEQFKNRNQ